LARNVHQEAELGLAQVNCYVFETNRYFRWDVFCYFERHFGHWGISVICLNCIKTRWNSVH